MVYVYKDADYDLEVTRTVLEFENQNRDILNSTMRDLSTAYKDNWDAEEAKAFVLLQLDKLKLTNNALGVKLGAATDIVNDAVGEFEIGNFWE